MAFLIEFAVCLQVERREAAKFGPPSDDGTNGGLAATGGRYRFEASEGAVRSVTLGTNSAPVGPPIWAARSPIPGSIPRSVLFVIDNGFLRGLLWHRFHVRRTRRHGSL